MAVTTCTQGVRILHCLVDQPGICTESFKEASGSGATGAEALHALRKMIDGMNKSGLGYTQTPYPQDAPRCTTTVERTK